MTRFGSTCAGRTAVLLGLILVDGSSPSSAGDNVRFAQGKRAVEQQAISAQPRVPLPKPKPDVQWRAAKSVQIPLPLRKPELRAKLQLEHPSPESKAPVAVPGPADEQGSFDEEACRTRLSGQGVRFELLPALSDPRGCGAPEPLRIYSLADVSLATPITLRCRMAEALAKWMAEVVIPTAEQQLRIKPTTLLVGTSYACRPRNNRAGAKLSEHAFANGIDLSGFKFDGRGSVSIAERPDPETPDSRFLAEIRAKACAYFSTVLGPGSDEAHGDHFHLDVQIRTRGYRLCQ